MYKLYVKKVIFAFSIFGILTLSIINNNAFAGMSDWNVKVTSDTKDLYDNTQEIVFKVQENPNVAKGKFAPGTVAYAQMEVDLTDTQYDVDFKLSVDNQILPSYLKITATLDGEEYILGSTKLIKPQNNNYFTNEDGKKKIVLKLEWENIGNSNYEDTLMGVSGSTIEIPVEWNISQHI